MFPTFMLTAANAIPASAQSTGVKGWVFNGADGMQTAYWICEQDGVSQSHSHDFDEYMAVIDGHYTLIMGTERYLLGKGDEFHIPPGVAHEGEFVKGTRTFHCFGGKRA